MDENLLAERWRRLLAFFLDPLLAIGIVLLNDIVFHLIPIPPDLKPNTGAFVLLVFVIAQLVLLAKKGQTIGKKMLGIKIVDKSSLENPGFARSGLIRSVLSIFTITIIVPLFDWMWIFRKGKRCLHDHIAGTIVIRDR
jgi:uncharacterized RDD family membrane protein YckC